MTSLIQHLKVCTVLTVWGALVAAAIIGHPGGLEARIEPEGPLCVGQPANMLISTAGNKDFYSGEVTLTAPDRTQTVYRLRRIKPASSANFGFDVNQAGPYNVEAMLTMPPKGQGSSQATVVTVKRAFTARYCKANGYWR